MLPRILLLLVGFALDIVGFLIAFTSYFDIALPGWEVGLVILAVGIVLDVVGLLI